MAKQSRGTCSFCGASFAKGGMVRHLAACAERERAQQAAKARRSKQETLFHLRITDSWDSNFWLDLEIRGTATLGDLDFYLREIWLECCGHLSQFSIGGWMGDEISMRRRIGDVFQHDDTLTHIYDFGTSSETMVRPMQQRRGVPLSSEPITLMARNLMPEHECIECDTVARWLCIECLYEDETAGTLCDTHVKDHPHEDYGEPFLIVNSPRVGMCGYVGPADPPY